MNFLNRRYIVVGVVLASPSAFASNYDGFAMTFIGMPAFAFFDVFVGVLLAFRPSNVRKAIASILAVPLFILGAALMYDAQAVLRHPGGWMEVALYYGLAILAAYLYYKLMSAQRPQQLDTNNSSKPTQRA